MLNSEKEFIRFQCNTETLVVHCVQVHTQGDRKNQLNNCLCRVKDCVLCMHIFIYICVHVYVYICVYA